MSQRKLTQSAIGRPKAPLTKLKELPATDRARVMEILRSHTYRDAEPLIAEAVGFACSIDALCSFFSWQGAQEDLEVSRDLLQQVLSFVRQNYSDWPEEKIREAATNFFALHTMAKRDVKGFASMARLYIQAERCRIKERKLELDQLKFEEASRRKLEAGMDAVAAALKKNPAAAQLFEQARQMIREDGNNSK